MAMDLSAPATHRQNPTIAWRRIALLAAVLATPVVLTGCETRVIEAKGIGSEQYDTQETFEEQYRLFRPPRTAEER
jgi:predicted small secreted protein